MDNPAKTNSLAAAGDEHTVHALVKVSIGFRAAPSEKPSWNDPELVVMTEIIETHAQSTKLCFRIMVEQEAAYLFFQLSWSFFCLTAKLRHVSVHACVSAGI